jgi:mannitol/fructose-specific phosphotransferase system IIA component (Ntr-type)
MIRIADTLRPERIRLNLIASTVPEAIRETAFLLRSANAVLDWEELYSGVVKNAPCITESDGSFALCLPHVRTDAVSSMVMSIGVSTLGVPSPSCPQNIRYFFCIGVPKALASDYLRIVGLLVRLLKDVRAESALHAAPTPAEAIDILSELEARL